MNQITQDSLIPLQKFFETDEDKTVSNDHFSFIHKILKNLTENPENEDARQFIFNPENFIAGELMISFFESIGFMKCKIDNDLYMIYTEPNTDNLKVVANEINFCFLSTISKKEEKAASLASLYENRINSKAIPPKKYKESNQDNKFEYGNSLKCLNTEYNKSKEAVENDLNDYRSKMKERFSDSTNDSNNWKPKEIEKSAQNNQLNVLIPQKSNENLRFTPKREDVFAFQNRRENEQRIIDAQSQLQSYREEMRRKTENGNFKGFKRETPPDSQVDENYDKIIEKTMAIKFGKKLSKNCKTMVEIEKQRIAEDQIRYGIKALEYTNEFRKSNGLYPISWNQDLCDIAFLHSKNMAEGVVPFGHDGFQTRVQKIPFHQSAACENVAFSSSYGEALPKEIVNNWINSEGHRKNLLSETNTCGIGVYRSDDGLWYFTQIFAKCIPLNNSFARFFQSLKKIF